ncbi:cytochrome oxidase assembly protein, partial [Oxalobacteraceae bacterium OM1]
MNTVFPLNADAARPWYKHRWPWLLMSGPAVVVLAASYTAYLAVVKQDALVVDDYYKQGKAINQDLRRDRAASRLLLNSSLRYDPAAGAIHGAVASMGAGYTQRIAVTLVHPTL